MLFYLKRKYSQHNQNILAEAINALSDKWIMSTDSVAGREGISDYRIARRAVDSYITATQDEKAEAVENEYSKEASDINTARNDYVSSLEGTGVVGTTY